MPDPILCEIVKNRLLLIAQEAGIRAARSAGSTFVASSAEAACALFDGQGRLIAQTEVGILHSAALRAMLHEVLRDHPPGTLADGDVLITNDPFRGGIHPTDVGAFRPIFHNGKPVFYCGLMMIVSDLGGLSSGGLPANASECFHEGMMIPPTKLYEAGHLNRPISQLIRANSRTPAKVGSDIDALAAGGNVAAMRIAEVIGKFGLDDLQAMIDEILDYSERLARAGIAALPDGTYRGAYTVENDGIEPDRTYPVTVTVTVTGETCRFDFTGSAAQATGAINATASQSLSCVLYALRCHLDPTIPMNEGVYRPFSVHFPESSVVNCSYPAACNIRLATGQAIIDAVLQALSAVDPLCTMAPAATVHTVNAQGRDARAAWGMLDVAFGSCGARPDGDGGDGLPLLFHGQAGYERNIEAYEWNYPVRYRRYGLTCDTAGPGRWRGGAGIVREVEFLSDAVITVRATDRCAQPPLGINGGGAAAGAGWILNRGRDGEKALPFKATNYRIDGGDTLTMLVPGGGGYGRPHERPADDVARDVRDGFVSVAAAAATYGVVVTADGTVDATATAARRHG